MAHTNSTPNYNLPQFLGTDKPAWLTDINNAMSNIDAAIAAAKTAADAANTAVSALAITVGNHTSQLSTLSGAVTSQGNTLNTVTALIGNGTPTTTDQTIIGAINELAAIVEAGSASVVASGNTYSTLYDALFAQIDMSKVTARSVLEVKAPTVTQVFQIVSSRSNEIALSQITSNSSVSNTVTVRLMASGSTYIVNSMNVGGATATADYSNSAVTDGTIAKLIY